MTEELDQIAKLHARVATIEQSLNVALETVPIIGHLLERLDTIESRIVSLIAFSAAMMDANQNRKDEIFTRWADELALALKEFSTLDEDAKTRALQIPFWVQVHKDPT